MTASNPQIPKIIIFTLGSGTPKSFAEDLIDCAVVPAPGDVQSVLTLDGVTHQDVSPVTWGLQIKAVQDWDSARPGLAQYLWANQGTTVPFVFKNEVGTEAAATPKFTGSCTLVPIPYGGPGNSFAEADVFLPITGTLTLDATP